MEELEKKVTQILDQFLLEARQVWPMSQFAILSLKSMILSEIKKLEKPEGDKL
jgi:hypothetical protein